LFARRRRALGLRVSAGLAPSCLSRASCPTSPTRPTAAGGRGPLEAADNRALVVENLELQRLRLLLHPIRNTRRAAHPNCVGGLEQIRVGCRRRGCVLPERRDVV